MFRIVLICSRWLSIAINGYDVTRAFFLAITRSTPCLPTATRNNWGIGVDGKMTATEYNRTDYRHCAIDSNTIAQREFSRLTMGGCFLCADERETAPCQSRTGHLVPVALPDSKRNRNRKRARVNNSPSTSRGARRKGATTASNSGDQTRLFLLREVFPGYGLVVDPAKRPTSRSTSDGRRANARRLKKPRPVHREELFAQPDLPLCIWA